MAKIKIKTKIKQREDFTVKMNQSEFEAITRLIYSHVAGDERSCPQLKSLQGVGRSMMRKYLEAGFTLDELPEFNYVETVKFNKPTVNLGRNFYQSYVER